jgi:hypothetical protein
MADVWIDGRRPELMAALPCEDGAVSGAMVDGRITVQRVFYEMYCTTFPAGFGKMNVATIWMGGDGGHAVGVRMSTPGGTVLVEAGTEHEPGPDPWSTVTHFFHLSHDGYMLRLPAPGRYTMDVLVDGVPVSTFPVYFILQTPPEEGGD